MPVSGSKKSKNISPSDAKYPHLVEQLTAQIGEGKLWAGEKLPTLIQLQETFDVTPHTVNRAMIALEHSGLIERRRGSGIFVRGISKRARQGTIGLYGWGFLKGRSSSYWTDLLEGIYNAAETTDSQLLLFKGKVGTGWEKVDGVILCTDEGQTDTLRFVPSQLPVVCLLGYGARRASVVADEYSGVRLAMQHLLRLGHRRIAYLHGLDQIIVRERLRAYTDALEEAGVSPRKNWVRTLKGKNDYGPQFTAAGRRDMAAWLNDKSNNGWHQIGCTALLCHNDETAIGVMESLREAGLKIPDDVSVVGFDGLESGEYSAPPLTSVEMPLCKMGEVAVELLQKQIETDSVSQQQHVLSTSLLVRESTSVPQINPGMS